MQRKAVTVCVRTRPTANFAQDNLKVNEESQTIDVTTAPSSAHANSTGPKNAKSSWSFKYDRVLHNSTQEGTYNAECSKIVETVVEGYNATIFAYGQTGAGKTFTMIGNTADFAQRGVTPRALNHLFREIEVRTDMDFTVTASYLEIYNERIFDLLDDVTNADQAHDYQIVEDKSGSTTVKGLTKVPVTSEEDALKLLFKGELGRTTATHLLNKRSNRSHCVFTLYVEQRSKLGGSEHIKTSKLNLVDLAGSERLKKTGADTDSATKRESMYINKSLSYLEQVVVALTTKSRTHIPYRQTKLTNILRDSLGGNCMTLMIACIWAEKSHLEETVSTLQLAQRMMKVRNSTQVNQHQDPTLLLKKYERTIKELRQELVMHDALSERVGVVYEEFTPEQLSNIKQEVNQYLASDSQDDSELITIASVKQIREAFKEFKRVHKQLTTELAYAQQHGSPAAANANGAGVNGEAGAAGAGDGSNGGSQVGELDDGNGFGLGNAASTDRPATLDRPGYGKTGTEGGADEDPHSPAGSPTRSSNQEGSDVVKVPADKNKAYAMFKETVASDLRDELARLNAITRGHKDEIREKTASINKCTADIKNYGAILEEKKQERMQRGEGSDVIDEEEFLTIKANKKARAAYREQLKELQQLKNKLSLSKEKALKVKSNLLDQFEEWHKANGGGVEEEEEEDVGDDDELDYGEKFEEMERARLRDADPDSVAFFNSKKLMAQTKRATRSGTQLAMAKKRNMQR